MEAIIALSPSRPILPSLEPRPSTAAIKLHGRPRFEATHSPSDKLAALSSFLFVVILGQNQIYKHNVLLLSEESGS